MPASIMSPTGSCSTGAPPAVQLFKSSRIDRGSHGSEAGVERRIAPTDMLAKTNTARLTEQVEGVDGAQGQERRQVVGPDRGRGGATRQQQQRRPIVESTGEAVDAHDPVAGADVTDLLRR